MLVYLITKNIRQSAYKYLYEVYKFLQLFAPFHLMVIYVFQELSNTADLAQACIWWDC